MNATQTYTRLFDVVDTSNHNTAVTILGPEYQAGSCADEFDALSFFVGFENPQ